MDTIWFALLGAGFAGYLVLGGYDYGVGLSLARYPSPAQRRLALTAVGPFFLGNEVWLVATLGILFGAFPMLEGELLSGLYPLIALALTGVVLVTAGVQLRSRPIGDRARGRWDRVVVAGSALAALGWGAVLAGLLQGVPLHPDGRVAGVSHVFTPFVATGALSLLAVVAVHGAAFLALRLPAEPGRAAARAGRRLIPAALAALAAATVAGLLSDQVRHGVRQPVPAVLLPVAVAVTLLLAGAALARRRTALALAATSVALILPVLGIAAANWPYALLSTIEPGAGLTVRNAAASDSTLRLLSWATMPLLPALLGLQVMSWWVFRGRIDDRTPVYW